MTSQTVADSGLLREGYPTQRIDQSISGNFPHRLHEILRGVKSVHNAPRSINERKTEKGRWVWTNNE